MKDIYARHYHACNLPRTHFLFFRLSERESERERSGFGKFESVSEGEGRGGHLPQSFQWKGPQLSQEIRRQPNTKKLSPLPASTFVINSLYLYFLLPHDYLTLYIVASSIHFATLLASVCASSIIRYFRNFVTMQNWQSTPHSMVLRSSCQVL